MILSGMHGMLAGTEIIIICAEVVQFFLLASMYNQPLTEDLDRFLCGRNYRGTFIWCDLCEDDFILPLRGSGEYILKASELFEGSGSSQGMLCFVLLLQPTYCHVQEEGMAKGFLEMAIHH